MEFCGVVLRAGGSIGGGGWVSLRDGLDWVSGWKVPVGRFSFFCDV